VREHIRSEGLVRTVIGRSIFVSRLDGQLHPADHGSSSPDLRHGRSEARFVADFGRYDNQNRR
jgi:hypothetical protein